MKLSQQSQAIIESAIQKAINKYTCGCEQTIVTDIHIQPNQNSGELFIYDDEDEELSSVPSMNGQPTKGTTFTKMLKEFSVPCFAA